MTAARALGVLGRGGGQQPGKPQNGGPVLVMASTESLCDLVAEALEGETLCGEPHSAAQAPVALHRLERLRARCAEALADIGSAVGQRGAGAHAAHAAGEWGAWRGSMAVLLKTLESHVGARIQAHRGRILGIAAPQAAARPAPMTTAAQLQGARGREGELLVPTHCEAEATACASAIDGGPADEQVARTETRASASGEQREAEPALDAELLRRLHDCATFYPTDTFKRECLTTDGWAAGGRRTAACLRTAET